MNPIDFRGQRSKVKVTMEIYGNKLVKARGCYALRCYFILNIHLRNECLFSRFMGNESQCGTNKSREPRSGSRAICLFRTAIHFPWTEKKRHSFLKWILVRFVCSALRFISHEPRKKDTLSLNEFSCDLFVPHCDSFPINREKKTLIPYIYNASIKTLSKILRAK